MAGVQQPTTAQFITQLKYCRTLPSLPTVAMQLIDLADNNAATLDDFANLISYDPALVGKLLRTANSAFYGQRRQVASLSEAVGLMGLNATISLSLSFSLRGLTGQGDGALDETRYWSRSLLTALAARVIAVELHEAHPEDFLLAGLLQDIGVLAMAALLGADYVKLYAETTDHVVLLSKESEAFGFNHVEAGEQLLKHWRLPDQICESVRRSHDPRPSATQGHIDVGHLSTCVAAAAHIADAWLLGATAETFAQTFDSVRGLLDISAERYQNIITSMGEEIPEMESLFEFELIDAAMLQSMQESARELLSMRNLRMTQDFVRADMQIQSLERRIAMLETHTQRDPLTGLYNRVFLDRQLQKEFDRALREHIPLSVAYVDIDHFKDINDTYGHAVGDQALIAVGYRMLNSARQGDTVARYGGEEFIVLLPNTHIHDAQSVMQRMLEAVRTTPAPTRSGTDTAITFSAGLAHIGPGSIRFHTAAELLEAADKALYQTKTSGRGQITVYDPNIS